jgi:serine/threonine-protein kinase
MLYEALTGRLPFEADSVGELFVKIGAGECVPLRIRRPDIDDRWHDVVHRAFDRDAERRFQDVESLRRELVPLASNVTAARARTISDGAGSPAVRGTIGYEGGGVPRDSPEPLTSGGSESEPPAPSIEEEASDLEEGEAASAPPAESARTGPRTVPGWAWAAIGAVAVLAIIIPLRMSSDDPPVANPATSAGPTPTENPSALDEGPTADAPPSEPELEARVAPLDAGVAAETVPGRRGSPASTAGLDPNPYR